MNLPSPRTNGLARFVAFGMVGASGLVINTGVLALLFGMVGLPLLVAVVMATQASTTWNFILSDHLVFTPSRESQPAWSRFLQFAAINNGALLLRGPMIVWLTAVGVHYLLANGISLVSLMVVRFAVSDRLIWRVAPPTPAKAEAGAAQ